MAESSSAPTQERPARWLGSSLARWLEVSDQVVIFDTGDGFIRAYPADDEWITRRRQRGVEGWVASPRILAIVRRKRSD